MLRDAIGEPDHQAGHLAAGRFAHLVGDALAQLKDLLGAGEAALLGDDTEAVAMAIVQPASSGSEKPKSRCERVWFVRSDSIPTLLGIRTP
jgi:hypothetical protein